ncbi:MAG: Uma2 family endonuclease, partial [Pyrinomonadaceae bacterium]|nr:Uma2 family endonuclease [Pyrinomonadaceae bacterium]
MQAISEITQQKNVVSQNGLRESESRQRKISVIEYDAMFRAGVYDENDKIELLNGVLIEKMSINPPHSIAVRRSNYTFLDKLQRKAVVITQDVIVMNDESKPEPDLFLLNPPFEKYDFEQPKVEDVVLIMEISDTTLNFDRNIKGKIYAESGVMQYLILNVNSREIEDYREPGGENYRYKKTYSENESFNLVAFPEIEIKVADLLPPEQAN